MLNVHVEPHGEFPLSAWEKVKPVQNDKWVMIRHVKFGKDLMKFVDGAARTKNLMGRKSGILEPKSDHMVVLLGPHSQEKVSTCSSMHGLTFHHGLQPDQNQELCVVRLGALRDAVLVKGAQLVAVFVGGLLVQVAKVLHGWHGAPWRLLGDVQLLHKLQSTWTLIAELVGATVMTLTEKRLRI